MPRSKILASAEMPVKTSGKLQSGARQDPREGFTTERGRQSSVNLYQRFARLHPTECLAQGEESAVNKLSRSTAIGTRVDPQSVGHPTPKRPLSLENHPPDCGLPSTTARAPDATLKNYTFGMEEVHRSPAGP